LSSEHKNDPNSSFIIFWSLNNIHFKSCIINTQSQSADHKYFRYLMSSLWKNETIVVSSLELTLKLALNKGENFSVVIRDFVSKCLFLLIEIKFYFFL